MSDDDTNQQPARRTRKKPADTSSADVSSSGPVETGSVDPAAGEGDGDMGAVMTTETPLADTDDVDPDDAAAAVLNRLRFGELVVH